jgi:hypothetical protein
VALGDIGKCDVQAIPTCSSAPVSWLLWVVEHSDWRPAKCCVTRIDYVDVRSHCDAGDDAFRKVTIGVFNGLWIGHSCVRERPTWPGG